MLDDNMHCAADQHQAYHESSVVPDADPGQFPTGKAVTACSDLSISFRPVTISAGTAAQVRQLRRRSQLRPIVVQSITSLGAGLSRMTCSRAHHTGCWCNSSTKVEPMLTASQAAAMKMMMTMTPITHGHTRRRGRAQPTPVCSAC